VGDGVVLVAVGVGEALLLVGLALGGALELLDVLWLVVGFAVGGPEVLRLLVGVALALVLAEELVLADELALAEDEVRPDGSALTEADALPGAEALPDADALPDAEALPDVAGDFAVAACRADFFFADFADFDFWAGFDAFDAFGDFAGWTAESSRTAALGRAEQAPFTMGEPPSTRSVVTEPNTVELVERMSTPATAPSAADLSATALTT
jgi:hypothetical protein